MHLRYIIIKIKDLQRAKKFYIQLLGQNPAKEEKDRMVVFDLGNIKIGLYNPLADGCTLDEADFGTSCMPGFGVDDVEAELKRVSEFAEIVSQKQVDYHHWFEFKDTEGNILEIHKI